MNLPAFLPILAAVLSLVVALVTTPLVIRLARRVGAVDRPDERRVNVIVVPRMGGLAMIAGFVAVAATLGLLGWLPRSNQSDAPLLAFAIGAALMAATGVRDDLKSLGAKKKLALQVVAATIAWYGGARVYEVVNLPFGLVADIGPVFSYLATVLWIVGVTNAINLIDGLDGLAGGLVFFATVTNVIVAIITDNPLAAALNAALAGAVLGFLFHNFNPAKIFMGDTGSLFLGYALSAGALLTSRQKESTLASLFVPIIALGIPITDTLLAMLRRVVERRSIFAADRKHIHHRLLELGLTHKRAVLFLYGTSVALCGISVLAAFGQDWQVGAALVSAGVVLAAMIRFARYFDGLLTKRPSEGLSPLALGIREHFRAYASALRGATTPEEVARELSNLVADVPGEFELRAGGLSTKFPGAPLSSRPGVAVVEHAFGGDEGSRLRVILRTTSGAVSPDVQASIGLAVELAATRLQSDTE